MMGKEPGDREPQGKGKVRSKLEVLHPFLLAIAPILSVYVHNMFEVSFKDTLIPMLISLVFTMTVFILLSLLIKNRYKAGIIVSLFLVLFFSYGFVLNQWDHPVSVLVLYGLLFIAGIIMLLRTKLELVKLTKILNVFAAVFVTFSLITIGVHFVATPGTPEQEVVITEVLETDTKTLTELEKSQLPDIYYIILDGYCREDILMEIFDYDNSEFIDYLEGKGFFVARDSSCNYSWTDLSLPSSLNFEYVPKGFTYLDAIAMVKNSALIRFLKEQGYKYVQFSTGYELTSESGEADLVIETVAAWRNEFTVLLINMTPLRELFPNTYSVTGESILNTLSTLPKVPDMIDGPRFIFAHILCPHFPYLFTREGELANLPEDASNDIGNREAYLDQLIFLNTKVKELVDKLLLENETPPIIIIQSDHGWGSSFILEKIAFTNPNPSETALRENTGILNAYYLPSKGREMLYESITPVNSFRVVLNCVFNANLPLLDDLVYWAPLPIAGEREFIDVTDIVRPR